MIERIEMKKKAFMMGTFWLFIAMIPGFAIAEDFLGVPLIPGAKTVLKTKKRIEMLSPLQHDKVAEFYKKAFKNLKDIRIRDWPESTYIEDDSNNPWHSVTISKKQHQGMTSIVIVKDNWTWIIGTLILRFIGVFVVLLCLFAGMSIYGAILFRTTKKAIPAKK